MKASTVLASLVLVAGCTGDPYLDQTLADSFAVALAAGSAGGYSAPSAASYYVPPVSAIAYDASSGTTIVAPQVPSYIPPTGATAGLTSNDSGGGGYGTSYGGGGSAYGGGAIYDCRAGSRDPSAPYCGEIVYVD